MADVIRCPHCGASNPPAATWCGQCLRRFEDAPPPQREQAAQPAAPEAGIRHPPPPEPHQADHVAGGGDEHLQRRLTAVPESRRGIRREGEAVFWTCPACENENPMELLKCSVCGTALATLFQPENASAVPTSRSRAVALALSAVLPGAGHGYLGMAGAAIGRGVLYLWTLGVGLLLTLRTVRRAAALVHGLGVVFLLAAAAVWILSYAEALRISTGDRTLLVPSRTLTWATAGLIFVLFAGLAVIAQVR